MDAPCSGEGIGFKAEESLKFWNLKNVRTIARLQEKLLIAGLAALKTGGELLYSTCTLNRFENEGVLEGAAAAFPGTFEIVFQKRFWPHAEGAGGFFVAKLRKTAPVPDSGKTFRTSPNEALSKMGDRDSERVRQALAELGTSDFGPETHDFFRYRNDVLAVRRIDGVENLVRKCYFLKFGERIGRLESGRFEPNWILGKNRRLAGVPERTLADDAELHRYLSGFEPEIKENAGGSETPDGRAAESPNASSPFVQISYAGRFFGLERVRDGRISNGFPKEWRRR